MHDVAFMEQAIALAEQGRGRTSPNPLVGALVVDESGPHAAAPQTIASGFHARLGGDHGEAAALKQAGSRARGKTLYVTLEPCNHIGRTGKCTDAILAAGITRVVVGMRDINRRVDGGGIERLRAAGISVTVGVAEEQCQKQNRGYLQWHKTGRPHLLMKAAISIDGRLAPAMLSGPGPQWLTSGAARHAAQRLRDRYDAILVGAGTVHSDDPRLTVRLPPTERRDERQPLRVVLDGALSISPSAKLCGPGALVITSDEALTAQKEKAADLRNQGVELLPLPAKDERHSLDLTEVLQALGRRELLYVMCEGGARLHGELLGAGLYDEAALFIAPLFLGEQGIPLARGFAVRGLSDAPWLDEVRVETLGPDVLVSGMLRKGPFLPREESEYTDVHRPD